MLGSVPVGVYVRILGRIDAAPGLHRFQGLHHVQPPAVAEPGSFIGRTGVIHMAHRCRHQVADGRSVVVEKHQIAVEIIEIAVSRDPGGMAVIAPVILQAPGIPIPKCILGIAVFHAVIAVVKSRQPVPGGGQINAPQQDTIIWRSVDPFLDHPGDIDFFPSTFRRSRGVVIYEIVQRGAVIGRSFRTAVRIQHLIFLNVSHIPVAGDPVSVDLGVAGTGGKAAAIAGNIHRGLHDSGGLGNVGGNRKVYRGAQLVSVVLPSHLQIGNFRAGFQRRGTHSRASGFKGNRGILHIGVAGDLLDMGINGYRIDPRGITEPFLTGCHGVKISVGCFRQSDLHLTGAGSRGVIHKGGVHQERGLLFRPAGNQHGTVLLELSGHAVGVQRKTERLQGTLFLDDDILLQIVPHHMVFEADVGLGLIKRLGFHLFRLLHSFIGLFDFLLRRDNPGERPGCRFYGTHAVSDLDLSARRNRGRRFLRRSGQNAAVSRPVLSRVFIR